MLKLRLVHAYKLEHKVCQGGEEHGHHTVHGVKLFATGGPSGAYKEENREREGSNGELEFFVASSIGFDVASGGSNDDDELDDETDEEEEIKLQKCNKDLQRC